MMEPLRNEYAPPNSPLEQNFPEGKSPLDTQSIDELLSQFPTDRVLPPAGATTRTQNPRLNRTAESIGSALGTTVGRMRNGLTLVQNRQREVVRAVSDRVSQEAESLSAVAVEKAEQLGDMAEERAGQFADIAAQRWNEMKRSTEQRVAELRREAALLRENRPLELIAAFTGAAFVVGVALRVWRANHD